MSTTTGRLPDACADPAMPFMELAVDPVFMEQRLRSFAALRDQPALLAIRVVRWKPARRGVLEYDVGDSSGAGTVRTLVGKVRAKSLDVATCRLASRLGACGLGPDSEDGVSVPPVVGTIPECHMWLQEKVQGVPGWESLAAADGRRVARAIGRALARLQQSLPPLTRKHSAADEMAHLRVTLARVSASHPQWERRLRNVQHACERLVASARQRPASGAHRDFYHDQVIVGHGRIWLLDLDLAAEADPALDVGNFTAHVAEQSLRMLGRADALAREEAEFVSGYFDADGRADAASIETYKTLSLARHIYLSTTFEERRPYTQALLTLCEQRLQL